MAWELLQTLQTAENVFYTLATAFVMLLGGFALGFVSKKLIYKFLHHLDVNKNLSRHGIIYDVEQKAATLVSYVIYLVTIITVLNRLQITSEVATVIVGIIVLLVVLSVVVAFRDSVPNFIAGMWLRRNPAWRKGNMLRLDQIEGLIERVGYFEVEMRTGAGDTLHIPNRLVRTKNQGK